MTVREHQSGQRLSPLAAQTLSLPVLTNDARLPLRTVKNNSQNKCGSLPLYPCGTMSNVTTACEMPANRRRRLLRAITVVTHATLMKEAYAVFVPYRTNPGPGALTSPAPGTQGHSPSPSRSLQAALL